MKIYVVAFFSALLVFSGTSNAQSAEDASIACTEAARLIDENDFVGALDEAEWCVESLKQLKQQRTLTVFPDTLNGYVGGELDNQSAMGMSIMEREYTLNGNQINVTLTGGVAGGGLAALAQLGLGMGSGGGKKMRIQKRTVIDMSKEGAESQYMAQLKSGGMLMISSNDLDAATLLEFVKAFPIAELDEALEP